MFASVSLSPTVSDMDSALLSSVWYSSMRPTLARLSWLSATSPDHGLPAWEIIEMVVSDLFA